MRRIHQAGGLDLTHGANIYLKGITVMGACELSSAGEALSTRSRSKAR